MTTQIAIGLLSAAFLGSARAAPERATAPAPAALAHADRALMWMPLPMKKVGYIPECTSAQVSTRRGDPEPLVDLLLAEGLAAAHVRMVEKLDPAALTSTLEKGVAPKGLQAIPRDGGEIYGGLVMHTSVCDTSDSHPRGVCSLEGRSATLTWRLAWFEMDSAPRGIAQARCRALGGAWKPMAVR